MIDDEEDDENKMEGTRFHSYDKIDYRQTIHRLVERCLINSHSVNYPGYVQDLVDSVDFDLHGFPLHELIDAQAKLIREEIYKEAKQWENDNPFDAKHPILKGVKEAEYTRRYYRALFKYVHQLLASRGLYLKSGKSIPTGNATKD
jgi:hypothetical protein